MAHQDSFTVGRGDDVDITLNDDAVSRFHMTMTLLGGNQVRIVDQDSMNGTYLDKGLGKVKIADQVVGMDDELLVGVDYRATPRQLLAMASRSTATDSSNEANTSPFSRYVRSDDGGFRRK